MTTEVNRTSKDPPVNDWATRGHIHTLMLMGATAAGLYLCLRIALPFLTALAWALALAVVFTPLQCWIESKVKRPNLAALLAVFFIGVIVFGLAWFVGQRLIREAVAGAELVKEKVESGEWRREIEKKPRFVPLADWMERQNLPGTVKALAGWMTSTGSSFVKGSVVELLGALLMFYLLFFLLRDRRLVLHAVRALSPLSPSEMDRMFSRVGETIQATIYGTLTVSAVQGLLGGLMFWWLGLPAPLLWGVVMAILAIVPALGAFVVWLPASVFLVIEGSWGKAIVLILWGALVVGTIDNLLRPVLVGQRLKLHTVLAFISVVGGLIVFGAAGLILGPVVLTMTSVLLQIWRARGLAESRPALPTEPDKGLTTS